MKNITKIIVLTFLIGVIGLHSVFAQTKIDEYRRLDSDSEASRMDNFLVEFQNQLESKGLIILYVNSKQKGLGNLSSHIKGIKEYLRLRINLNPQRYSIQIKEGNPRKELWLYPKDVELPKSDSLKFDIDDVTKPFYYGQTCIECAPAVPLLSWNYIDFEQYAKFIKTNDNYKALITIEQSKDREWTKEESYQDAINNIIEYRRLLVEDYGIPKNKVKIIIKKLGKEKISGGIANFYIVKK